MMVFYARFDFEIALEMEFDVEFLRNLPSRFLISF